MTESPVAIQEDHGAGTALFRLMCKAAGVSPEFVRSITITSEHGAITTVLIDKYVETKDVKQAIEDGDVSI